MLSSMPQAATDALYEARQQRRKQLLKEQMKWSQGTNIYIEQTQRLTDLSKVHKRGWVTR